jgi:DNA-binding response OmpR family regulator
MSQPCVLIVEDEFLVASMVESTLCDAGYDVCGIAGSEDRALQLAERHRPLLALVDIRLSPGDGRRVARELRRRYGTIVLFASAHCDDLREELALEAPTVCLEKPYDFDLLPQALDLARSIALGERPEVQPPPGISFVGARELRGGIRQP